MKRVVVINEAGQILATAPHHETPGVREGHNPPVGHGYIPLPGQQVHVVELPDGVTTLDDILRMHHTHAVHVADKHATLRRR